MAEIAVIGGGPIGCYSAYLLAKSGHQVAVYEDHSEIGLPLQCSGIFSADFDHFHFPLDYFLVNTIKKIEVYAPDGHKTTVKQKNYIVDRKRFDQFLAEMARMAGVKIFLNHALVRKDQYGLIIKDTLTKKEKRIYPEIVVGADGPLSSTAKAYGLYLRQRQNYLGIQAVVEGNFAADTIQTFFGREVCPGFFAWIVPESKNRARVALATKQNTRFYFNQFIQKHHFKVLELQAGVAPLYHPQQRLKKGNCYLVGDAAGFVKATTLGGVIPGLKQAQALNRAIKGAADYSVCASELIKEMKLHLRVRTILDKFSDEDWNKLIAYVNQPKVNEVMGEYTRDNPFPLVAKLFWREPRLLYFAKYLDIFDYF